MDKKSLIILGSTGSIGVQALEVAEMHSFPVVALTASSSVDVLEEQIRRFSPRFAALADEKAARELKARVADTPTRVLSGREGVCECAALSADIVLNGIVGIAGLEPTLRAIDSGSTVALANKETLVAGGELVMGEAARRNVPIIPVDSEHSAIFQSLAGSPGKSAVKRLILTASGGPFFGKSKSELASATPESALKHPNWSMGQKITVDSATMMNKGLELIEAVRLFGVSPDRVDIVVHRQSIVHSLVEYVDGSQIAQLGLPDMRIPIQYALTYPERCPSPVKTLELSDIGTLTFKKPDYEVFPCINLCREAIEAGGLVPAAANAANEEANLLFRQGKIGFYDIPRLVREAMNAAPTEGGGSLEEILSADVAARELVGCLTNMR